MRVVCLRAYTISDLRESGYISTNQNMVCGRRADDVKSLEVRQVIEPGWSGFTVATIEGLTTFRIFRSMV